VSGLALKPPAATGGVGSGRVIEIQRVRILAAMVEESAQRGSASVTVAHIVARAGVSRRTFYELFADREQCFLAAFDDALEQATRHVKDTYDPSAGWVERVRSALIAILSFLDLQLGAGRLLVVGSLGAGAGALERRKRVLAQITAILDQGRTHAKTGIQPPPLTGEGIVGGVLSIIHARLLDPTGQPLLTLTAPLMSTIVLPYIGPTAAQRELERPAPKQAPLPPPAAADPLRELGMRLTYRTVRVLSAVATTPGGSNRLVADAAGIGDQGQISKLLTRLHRLGLIENGEAGQARGAPNAWQLTARGVEIERAISRGAG
jgi:AcrR family transcriptional regulator